MQYVLLIHEGQNGLSILEDSARAGPYYGAWGAYAKSLAEAGALAGGAGLQPPETATTLTLAGGSSTFREGRFAEGEKQLTGFFVINVVDLDAALDCAARAPIASGGSIEVRAAIPAPER